MSSTRPYTYHSRTYSVPTHLSDHDAHSHARRQHATKQTAKHATRMLETYLTTQLLPEQPKAGSDTSTERSNDDTALVPLKDAERRELEEWRQADRKKKEERPRANEGRKRSTSADRIWEAYYRGQMVRAFVNRFDERRARAR